MRIKRYFAKDMRQALRLVREEQGADAVILSSQRTAEGVEVTAAVERDTDAGGTGAVPAAGAQPPAPAAPAEFGRVLQQTAAGVAAERPAPESAAAAAPVAEMNSELKRLRQMLETQVATLAWNDLTRRAPVQAELLRELTALGIAPELAAELAAQAPRAEFAEVRRQALAQISQRIHVEGDRLLEEGGMVALVGPAGAGKTTALAKLAARWVLTHGTRDVALVSTDAVRFGAQEQIHTLGRLLGVAVSTVECIEELPAVLQKLADRRLVLIDTAGLSPRDPQLAELEALAAAHPRLRTVLVLNTSAQCGAIDEALARFAGAQPSACLLTRLDEASTLGGVLSLLIRTRLPVGYVSEGQRIPEDLAPARAHQLVARAVELARRSESSADEDLLRRRFGAIAHGLV